MFSINTKLVIFPFLFSIFPIILLYSDNIDEVPNTELIAPLILTFLITLALFTFLNFILKNSIKAGFIVTLLSAIFFSYGYIFNMLEYTFLFDFDLIHHRYVLLPFIISFIVGVYYFVKTKKKFIGFGSIFNVISIVMILFVSINIGIFYLENDDSYELLRITIEDQVLPNNVSPDIYHIILDEYTSSQVLQEDFQYDNSDFIEHLINSNFFVPSNPISNYPATEPFLYSTLNMQYLNNTNLEKYDRLETDRIINDNFVMKFLKQQGYKIIVPYSGYGEPDKFLESDENPCSDVIFLKSRFLTVLSRTTIINYFIEKQIENELRYIQLCTLSELSDIGKKYDVPVYALSHLLIPHAPYLFDKDGNAVTPQSNKLKGIQGWNNANGYLNEIQFINKKIESITTEILSQSNNSIIIIQGDTGSSILNNPDIDDYIKKRLSVLFAIHLPNGDKKIFPDTTTSANIYRVIFNNYFETNYEILDDRYFWYSEFENSDVGRKKFIDVTDIIKPPKL
jgi:hypothetical protein